MILYESDYTKVVYDSDDSIIEVIRTGKKMNEEIYKSEMIKFTDLLVSYKPVGFVMNNKKMNFLITPAIQSWINDTIFPRLIDANVTRGAYVVSDDLFTQVSIEQALDEDEGKKITMRIFNDVDEAKKWILNK